MTKYILISIVSILSFTARAQTPLHKLIRRPAAALAPDSIFINIWDSVGNIGRVLTPAYNNVTWPVNSTNYSTYFKYNNGSQSSVRLRFLINDESSGATVEGFGNLTLITVPNV